MTAEERALAQKIYRSRSRLAAPGRRVPAYYLLQLAHPGVQALYRAWREREGLRPGEPMEDAQRIAFELALLRPEVAQYLAGYADWADAQRQEMGAQLFDRLQQKAGEGAGRWTARGR